MKKLLLALAATTLFSVASAQTVGPEVSAPGTIEFRGWVTNAPCSLSTTNVDLGSPSVRDLNGESTAWNWGTGSINLSNCDLTRTNSDGQPISAVEINVNPGTGANDGQNRDIWSNLGTAGNVGVEIKIRGIAVKPNGTTDTPLEQGLVDQDGAQIVVEGRTRKVSADAATPGTVRQNLSFVARFK